MSLMNSTTVTCPQCGQTSEFTVWESINTAVDPDMKEKVRTGEAFLWTCPHCGLKSFIDYPVLYHQQEDNFMVQLCEKSDAERFTEHFKKMQKMLPDGAPLDFRVVTNRYQFMEKLILKDHALEDKAIEIMKVFSLMAILESNPELAEAGIEEVMIDVSPEGELVTGLHLSDGRWGYLPFSRELYAHIEDQFRDEIMANDSMLINADWARRILDSKR
jgi:hypothetical protein